jgi:hypothetical protein
MLESEEFAIMRLPHLVAKAAENYLGGKVFFLHVPKTAGTSLRLALIEEMGFPALDAYGRVGNWDSYSLELLELWPLLVGHLNIGQFPIGTHKGITVFREPRLRVLSLFRQRTKSLYQPNPHRSPEGEHRRIQKARKLESGFAPWLLDQGPLDLASWYVDYSGGRSEVRATSRHDRGTWNNRNAHSKLLENYTQKQLVKQLEVGFKRIQLAEWVHDSEALRTLPSRAVGRVAPRAKLQTANTVHPEQRAREISLDAEALKKLDEITLKSQPVFDVAVNAGLISPLEKDKADELFENGAKRLGFKL